MLICYEKKIPLVVEFDLVREKSTIDKWLISRTTFGSITNVSLCKNNKLTLQYNVLHDIVRQHQRDSVMPHTPSSRIAGRSDSDPFTVHKLALFAVVCIEAHSPVVGQGVANGKGCSGGLAEN
jgi:hypothetical protein